MTADRFEQEARERRERAAQMRADHLDDGIPDEVADALFGHAWEEGHAHGWHEVANAYADLSGVVNMAYRAGAAR